MCRPGNGFLDQIDTRMRARAHGHARAHAAEKNTKEIQKSHLKESIWPWQPK